MNLKIVLVEDETIIAEYFKTLVEKSGHQVSLIFDPDQDFRCALQNLNPDLVFLDINLDANLSGIDLAQICRKADIPFIFITSYSDSKTIESAMKYEPLSYILKPFSEQEIFKTLEIAKIKLNKRFNEETISIKEGYNQIKLPIEQILWLKADNVYTEIATKNRKIIQRNSLSEFHKMLPQELFIRVHRSYVVNKQAITKVASDHVEIGENHIPLSRSKKQELLDLLA